MQEVFVESGPPRLPRDQIVARIRDYLEGTDVIRAILFGSFARGEADVVSDVDLMLVEASDARFTERGLRHLALFRMGFALDLLIYTPEEFDRMKSEGRPFIETICREGVEIHARSNA